MSDCSACSGQYGGGSLKIAATCNDMPASVDWLLRVRIGDKVQEYSIHRVNGQPQWQVSLKRFCCPRQHPGSNGAV